MNSMLSMLAVTGSTRLNPVELFLQADIVVQAVMTGLLLASVWVWMIIFAFSLRMGRVSRRSASFEQDFWEASNVEEFCKARGKGNVPSSRTGTGKPRAGG